MNNITGKKAPQPAEIPVSQRMENQEVDFNSMTSITRRNRKSFYDSYLPYVAIAAIALMVADLTAIKSRMYMIPAGQPPSRKANTDLLAPYKARSAYDDILARNIFNSDGFIPDVQVAGNGPDITGPAKESQLGLTLIGTIVHANPGKSVATIELKNNPEKVIPYIPNDEIEGLATLIKVERKRAYLRNLSSGAIEYIRIKDEPGISFSLKSSKQDGPIETEGAGTFGITRTDLEAQMSNLPELLTQARGVPNITNGRVDGFKIMEIVPGSIYTKLGIQDNDVLKEVDGEKLDSPAKAMELYNSLRNKTSLRISGERNGQPFTTTYNIH